MQETDADPFTLAELRSVATGLKQGLLSYSAIEPHLVSWLYEGTHKFVGFEAKNNVNNPWNYWAKHEYVNSFVSRVRVSEESDRQIQ